MKGIWKKSFGLCLYSLGLEFVTQNACHMCKK
jgi:hypothetical protein